MKRLFRLQDKFNERVYDILEDCFTNESQECITDQMIRDLSFSEISIVLEILVSQKIYDESRIKLLQHYKSTTLGLWATDRPDLIKDPEKVLFELK